MILKVNIFVITVEKLKKNKERNDIDINQDFTHSALETKMLCKQENQNSQLCTTCQGYLNQAPQVTFLPK